MFIRGIELIFLAFLMMGCSSLGPTDTQVRVMGNSYEKFISQSRTGKMIVVKGTPEAPADFHLSGTEISILFPLEKLSALGNDQTRSDLIRALSSVAQFAIGAWGATEMVNALDGGTVNNYSGSEP